MKLVFKLSMLVLFFISCSENPLVTKYDKSYTTIKNQLIERSDEFDHALSLMPESFAAKVNLSRTAIINNDLDQFIKQERLNEAKLSSMIDGVSKFIALLDERKNFRPSEAQTKMYNDLRAKMLEKEEMFRTYISNSAKMDDMQMKATATFLSKILDHDVNGFLAKSFTNDEDFSMKMNDYTQNFDEISANVFMTNKSVELDNMKF